MKKHVGLKAILILTTIFMLISLVGCNSERITLSNTDFEEGMTDVGGVTGWQRYDYNGKMAADNPYTEFSVNGDGYEGSSVCIENMQLNDARIYQHVDAPAGTKYKISAMIKTENVSEEGAGANISVLDYAGTSERVIGTKDWKEITLYVDVTTGKKGFDICLCLGGYSSESSGKAYFDSLVIEEVKSIPSEAYSVTVYDSTKSSGSSENENTQGIPWLDNLFKVLFFAAIAGLAVYVIVISRKSDKLKHKKGMSLSVTRGKPDKYDWIIMGVMTLVIGVISFINLGDTDAASNYWRAQNNGEYVIVEFDEETEVGRYTYYGNIPTGGKYSIYYENENEEFVHAGDISKDTFFEWKCKDVSFTTKRIKVVAESAGLALNEVAFFTKDTEGQWQLINVTVTEEQGEVRGTSGTPGNLFDEQNVAASTRTYMNGTYFDEIYFPRTGYEHVNGLTVYETTHPPLGKLFIALGIKIFGMNPFGWRFMGTLLGVLLVPVMYLFALKIFKKRLYAFAAAFLMMFDFMRFAQTRLATIDTYSVLFVMLMYYYMYDYFTTKSYDLRFTQSLKPLIFCGLFFGVGIASKWTSMYAGAGLAFLFFLAKYLEYQDIEKKRTRWPKDKKPWIISNFGVTCLVCLVFFIIIPAIIYTLCYIPYKAGDPDKDLITIMLDNQISMYNYHSNLDATHSFSSSWWQWPIMMRPIWYYVKPEVATGMRATIVSFGNPAVWWTGIAAVVASMVIAWKKRDKKMTVIFVAFALQFCPWMLVTRCTFIYHFFTSVPFVILMIIYCAKYFIESKKIQLYNGIIVLLLISAPVSAGCLIFFPQYAPPALTLFAFSIVAYLMERYGDKPAIRYSVPALLVAGTVACVIWIPTVAPVTGALLIGWLADVLVRIKEKNFKGLSVLIYYLAVVLGLFVAFYPALSGMEVRADYIEELRWFPSWYF